MELRALELLPWGGGFSVEKALLATGTGCGVCAQPKADKGGAPGGSLGALYARFLAAEACPFGFS